MHDFGDIVYLDLQKTGSTFVSEFLRFACVCPERKFQKHGWITDDLRSSATYFITVRHPHALYSALYRYGLDRKGAIYNRLHRAGRRIGAQARKSQHVEIHRIVADPFRRQFDNAGGLALIE